MKEHIEIHHYEKSLRGLENYLNEIIEGRAQSTPWKKLSPHNAKLIVDFGRTCTLLEGARLPTQIKYIQRLVCFLGEFLKMDAEGATREDMKTAM